MKKMNKKGFSLVELIVVIAIMAVLVGVLAPALMSNVEKSRAQKDDSAMAEVAHAVELAIADEAAYDEVVAKLDENKKVTFSFAPSNGTVTIASAVATADYPKLLSELQTQIGTEVKLTSKTHRAQTYTVVIDMSGTAVKVTGSWPTT